jgi:hypothetical protein
MQTVGLSINTTNIPHANKLVWGEGEWNKLHEITKRYEYSATKFKNGDRKNKSAKGVSLIILDFDEIITLKQGIEHFSSYKSLIVTTKSHQIEKNGVVADRFRVILFLALSIIDMNYYSKLMRVLTRYYKSDIACSDSARYYSPSKNQLVYYSDSKKIFDITRFNAMINSSEEKVQKHITRPKKEQEQQIQSTLSNRVELSSLLDVKVEYYHFGMRTVETLEKLIANTIVSDTAIKCHCFLNPSHEDKNPSCFIYHNEHSIYAKCVSCQVDGIINF